MGCKVHAILLVVHKVPTRFIPTRCGLPTSAKKLCSSGREQHKGKFAYLTHLRQLISGHQARKGINVHSYSTNADDNCKLAAQYKLPKPGLTHDAMRPSSQGELQYLCKGQQLIYNTYIAAVSGICAASVLMVAAPDIPDKWRLYGLVNRWAVGTTHS